MQKREGRHIGILVPTTDMVMSWFAYDLAVAMSYHMAHHPDDTLVPIVHQGTLLARSRNVMAEDALSMGLDWLLWLDSDMRFPPDTIARLLESGHDIVTTNAPKRKEPIGSTAHRWSDEEKKQVLIDISETSDEIVEVNACGFAVCIMRAEVFNRIERPWFWTPYLEDYDLIVGEDYYFASKAQQAGIKIMCDLELSEEIGHIGIKDYYLEDARMWNEILEQRKKEE